MRKERSHQKGQSHSLSCESAALKESPLLSLSIFADGAEPGGMQHHEIVWGEKGCAGRRCGSDADCSTQRVAAFRLSRQGLHS